MKYLVDANVLCEPTKPAPAPAVVDWLRAHEHEIAVNPVILGEVRFGIHLLASSKRRQRLEDWFDHGIARIHCVAWDAPTGLRWAKLLVDLRRAGRSMPIKDSLIAATGLVHNFTIVTRNVRDFSAAGASLLDPFAPAAP